MTGIDDFDAAARKKALLAFKESIQDSPRSNKADNNMHCHTFYSYNGYNYSPTHVVCKARELGLYAVGKIDFDVLDGLDEFLDAAKVLGMRACGGLESRVMVEDLIEEEINSPGEPGIAYHLGVGFASENIPGEERAFLNGMKKAAADRTRVIVEKVNPFLSPVELDFEKDVLPLTPAGNATERHVCAAYAAKAEALFSCPEKRAGFWMEKLGVSREEAAKLVADSVKLQGVIRSKTMKSGGPGYMKPQPSSFPKLEDMNRFTRACGGIPSIAWLNGESSGESDPERLLDLHESKGVAAFNLIPDRNWNFADSNVKAKKVANMEKILDACIARDLPVFAGTEINAYGQKLVDDFSEPALAKYLEEFRKGAALLSGHTIMTAYGAGYLSDWAEKSFATRKEKNAFYTRLGDLSCAACVKRLEGKDVLNMTPGEVMEIFD